MPYLEHSAKEKLLIKMRSYCDYQPRSHFDLRQKMNSLGIWKRDREEIIAQLIVEGYLNEQRFADSYTIERSRQQQWGRVKIKSHLKNRFVSDRCITDAMKLMNEDDYISNLHKHARGKWDSVKGVGANLFVKMRKTGNYLLQKGYESKLIWEVLNKLKKGEL